MLAAALAVASPASAQTSRPPPGASIMGRLAKPHLVDVGGGRRLNLFCIGDGTPTVVFEQGGEGNIANWRAVQPEISALTRTCFYDRAGFGYSDPPAGPVTPEAVTDDLRALLKAAHIGGPIVLVGHSIGGFYATVFADRFPEAVAGLVLVDPGFSGQEQWKTPAEGDADRANIFRGEAGLLKCAELARAGKLTAETLTPNGCFPPPADLSAPGADYLMHAITRPAWYEAEHSQSVQFFSRDQGLSAAATYEAGLKRPFGSLPMVVLTAGQPPSDDWRSADQTRRQDEAWRAGHQALAKRSTVGRWKLVPGAGHFIQKDQPSAVVVAIREVLAQAWGR